MTKKLYYQSSNIFSFDAQILDIRRENNADIVVLDQTAFFPEGGGQPGDSGFIGTADVVDTQIRNGEILHYVRQVKDLERNQTVRCVLNRKLRFSRMQAHSGEHIVSGLAHVMYHANNVGFHMDDLLMTVDFDQPLSKDQLSELEICANEVVWQNKRIRTFFPKKDEIGALKFRSKAEAYEDLRLVEIEGCDLCACCAPHVSQTGEIGLIKILSGVSHRGGVRITLVCGRAAFEDYQRKYQSCISAAGLLKVPHDDVVEGVEALLKKNEDLRSDLMISERKTVDVLAASLSYVAGNLTVFTDHFSSDALFRLAESGKSRCGGLFAAFSGDDNSGYRFIISSDSVDVQSSVKEITSMLNGKGGGRGAVAQGTLYSNRDSIEKFFSLHSFSIKGER